MLKPSPIIDPSKFSLLEIFDGSIIGLGLSTLGATLFLKPVLPHFDGQLSESFFAVIYPVADLILISLTLAAVLAQGFSYRGCILILGISITQFRLLCN